MPPNSPISLLLQLGPRDLVRLSLKLPLLSSGIEEGPVCALDAWGDGGVTEQDSSVCLLMLLLPHPVLLLVFVSK